MADQAANLLFSVVEPFDLKTRIRVEQSLAAKHRPLRYLLLVAFSYFTLMDAIKIDAYNAALLRLILPTNQTTWTVKQVSAVLVTSEVNFAAIQMIVIGLVEQNVPPSIWCTVNFFLSLAAWFLFDQPDLGLTAMIVLFLLRSLNVRYAVMVHWFGDKYFKYTMAVQFFISVFPHILKLPLFHYHRAIVFQEQFLLGAIGTVIYGLVACTIFWYWKGYDNEDGCGGGTAAASAVPEKISGPDKTGSWLSNFACTFFLAGVYYDFPMFTTYAKIVLGLDITYEMVYVHVGLFTSVFFVNVWYNLFKHCYRRWLRSCELTAYEILRRMNRARFLFIVISYVSVLISRVTFLLLQLYVYPSFTLLVMCACLGGLGGNVQPLLAELMFRQRSRTKSMIGGLSMKRERMSENGLRRRWKQHSDQIFKWMYVDGRSVMNLFLLLVWITVSNYVGSWWFSANTISLILLSFALFLYYYYSHAHRINQELLVAGIV
jgi:hypothetical protein